MLQQKKPDDYVIATGESNSVKKFCEYAFKLIDMNIIWRGKGVNEKGINKKNGKVIIEVDPQYYRPTDVNCLLGDPSKAKKILKWRPKVKFKELVEIMVKNDLDLINSNRL